MNQPKVSVIIPVYNTEKYLRECLDSVVNQTLRDVEIICVNDGSTDGSLSILEEYEKNNPNIIVINQPNRGPSVARNHGMRFANGDYLYFIDSDDYVDNTALEYLTKIADEKKLDVLRFGITPFFETEQLQRKNSFPWYHNSNVASTEVQNGIEYLAERKEKDIYIINNTISLMRRALIQENNISFKEGIIHEDNLFTFQVLMAADRVFHIPDILYHRRVRPDSIMTTPTSAKNVIGYFTCAANVVALALNNNEPGKEQAFKHEYLRLLVPATREYKAIIRTGKDEITFANETENVLFDQLVRDKVRLETAQETQKEYEQTLAGTKKELEKKEAEIEEKNQDIEKLRKWAANRQQRVDELVKEIEEKNQDIEKLRKWAENRQQRIDELVKEREEKNQNIEKLRKWIDNRQQRIDELVKEREEKNQNIEKLRKWIDNRQQLIDELRDQLNKAKADAAKANEEAEKAGTPEEPTGERKS